FIIMSNHHSHLDSFLVAYGAFPRAFRPFFFPADVKLWKSFLFRIMLVGFNTIPIFKKQSGEKHATTVVRLMTEVVRSKENLIYFPEGARSKDGKLQKGKIGTGWLVHETRVPAIPCALKNTTKAMPVGKGFSFGGGPRRIQLSVKFGPQVDLREFYHLERSPETSKLITERIMEEIKALNDSL
ncbi:MAG: lysophospholipid acyltransferase family protein, partial [Candidatus Hodarchaeales archaeon]